MLYKCSNCQNIIDDNYLTVGQLRHFSSCVMPIYHPLGSKINYTLIPYNGDEMPKATLSYEALTTDNDGIPTEGAYKLKLEGNFKNHIEPIVKFIKASIPSSDRTYDPNTYEWAFHERYWPLMEQAFKGSHFQVQFTVRKEDFVELKRKQAEWAKQAGQNFQVKQYPVEADIMIFSNLIDKVGNGSNLGTIRDWTRQEAEKAYKKAIRFFHPDLHPERASEASSLNEVWSRLKEGYYIK
jgi:hypothetical protein